MAKVSLYFSHDAGARNDPRVLRLRMQLGAEGYGIYFMILEWMRESENYTLAADIDVVAFDLRADAGKVRAVLEDFGLFEKTGGGYVSASFSRRMEKMDGISQKRREAVEKRNDRKAKNEGQKDQKSDNSTNAVQNFTNVLQKSGFVPENKIENKNININPSPDGDGGKRVRAHTHEGTPPTSPPDEKNIFVLADAASRWCEDREWAEAVCEVSEIPVGLLGAVISQFVKYCKSQGKQHEDEGDAKSHFARSLSKDVGRKWVQKARRAQCVATRREEKHEERRGETPASKPLSGEELRRHFGQREGESIVEAMKRKWAQQEQQPAQNTASL